MIVTTSEALADLCTTLRSAPYVAVDTEFVRERTYYAQLCLVQVAHGAHAAVIDPLAPGIDLAPLHALLSEASVLKVFHAAGQDLEIFAQSMGSVPTPVFDTQVAASVLGLGESPGYAALVSAVLGVQLDKASQRADWSKRPLTDRLVSYALGDVTHLCTVFELLTAQLRDRSRTEWVSEEMRALSEPARYRVLPEDAWRRVKIRNPDRRALAIVRALAAWRETTAMTRDLPRGWVLHDESLAEIALHAPENRDALARVKSMKSPFTRGADGEVVIALVKQVLAAPETWPDAPRQVIPEYDDAMVSLLAALLRARCEAEGVAPRMIATHADLEKLAANVDADIPAMKGWRRTLFGDDALALREGRLALTGGEGGVKIERS